MSDNGAQAKSVWDHESDKELLLAIIDGTKEGGKYDWPSVAERVQGKGFTFTKEACRQHFQKIRKQAREGGKSTAPIAGTPRKRTSTGTPKTPRSSGKSGGLRIPLGRQSEGEAQDGDDDFGTPSKKRRTSGKAAAAKMKKEVKSEDEENEYESQDEQQEAGEEAEEEQEMYNEV